MRWHRALPKTSHRYEKNLKRFSLLKRILTTHSRISNSGEPHGTASALENTLHVAPVSMSGNSMSGNIDCEGVACIQVTHSLVEAKQARMPTR